MNPSVVDTRSARVSNTLGVLCQRLKRGDRDNIGIIARPDADIVATRQPNTSTPILANRSNAKVVSIHSRTSSDSINARVHGLRQAAYSIKADQTIRLVI